MKSVYITPGQSNANADMAMLGSEDNAIMGRDINWRPQQYMHIEGVGTENATEVSSILGMVYKTHEERWSERGENIWECCPRNLRVVHPRSARDEATRHGWKCEHAARTDYIWTPSGAWSKGCEAIRDEATRMTTPRLNTGH